MRAALLLLALASGAAAQTVPPLTGRVVDTADILSAETEAGLTARLADAEAATGAQVAVLTVPSLSGAGLEAFATDVFRTWRLGDGRDNGALLLVSRDDRQLRIETGYGLEGDLTDARAATIIRTAIVPRFRLGDFDAGTEAGVEAILASIGAPDPRQLEPQQLEPFVGFAPRRAPASQERKSAALVIILLALAGVVWAVEPGLPGAFGTFVAASVGLIAGLVIAIALLMATDAPESYAAIPTVTLAAALWHASRERTGSTRRAARRRRARQRAEEKRSGVVLRSPVSRRDSDEVGRSNAGAWRSSRPRTHASSQASNPWYMNDIFWGSGTSSPGGRSSGRSHGSSSGSSSHWSSGGFRGGGGSSGGGGASGSW